jgi:predicted acylesterase/phospholipase RssA
MRQHILYVSGEAQQEMAKIALTRLKAIEVPSTSPLRPAFELKHPLLGNMVLQVNLLSELDAITAHLRQNPVDLLIYDERGSGGVPALKALTKIRSDVQQLAELWGPDFLFPMSRVVAILDEKGKSRRVFELGRLNVRDVILAPRNLGQILLWLKDVLWHGIIREQKVGIALGGGGIEGFLYQIGVLHALDQAIETGTSLRQCQVISGVSSGAIAGAMFASNLPIIEVIKSIKRKSDLLPPLTSSTIFDLATTEISRRVIKQSVSWKGLDPRKWINDTMRSVPTGFFKGDRLEEYFRTAIEAVGQEDRFGSTATELLIGATDHDTYEHITLGQPPWDKIRISEAIRASCALPPIFLPKQINGRWFIDGQVTRSCNLSMVVEKGCRLVIVINPLKPFTSHVPGVADEEGGLFTVIQTIKALVSTRFDQVLRHASESYPDVDFIVFEPDAECAEIMAGSPMKYRIRTKLIRLAYHATMRKLRERHHVYSAKFAKYGIKMRSVEALKELENHYDQLIESVA